MFGSEKNDQVRLARGRGGHLRVVATAAVLAYRVNVYQ